MATGYVVLAVMVAGAGAHVSAWDLVPGELLAGAGLGRALPPLFDFVFAGVMDHEVGSASGVLRAIQQFSAALGIAVFATVFLPYINAKHLRITAMKWTTLFGLIPLALAFLAV